MPNYHINFEIQTPADGVSPFRATITLAPLVKELYPKILKYLQENNSFYIDYEKRSFTIEEKPDFEYKSPSQTVKANAISITMDLFDEETFDFLTKKLHETGVGLERGEIHDFLMKVFKTGSERFYVRRAYKFFKDLGNNDDVTAPAFANITRLAYQMPTEPRISFVHKFVKAFMLRHQYKCAANLISLYSKHELCLDLAELLKQEMTTPPVTNGSNTDLLRETLNGAPDITSINLGTVEALTDDDLNAKILIFTLLDAEKVAPLFAAIKDLNKILINEEQCEFAIELVPNTSNPPTQSIKFIIPNAQRFKVIDYIFMQLVKHGYHIFIENVRAVIRTQLGIGSKEAYDKFLLSTLSLLKQVGDKPESFEFRWIESLSYEIVSQHQAAFVLAATKQMQAAGLKQCALAMSAGYIDEPVCTELAVLAKQLRATVAAPVVTNASSTKLLAPAFTAAVAAADKKDTIATDTKPAANGGRYSPPPA